MCLLAGIDVRTFFAREAKAAPGRTFRRHLTTISKMIDQGGTFSEGLAASGDYFPILFCEMVHVGEQSGHLGEVLKQLANHYQNQVTLQRNFLASISWPIVQLFLAVGIVGFVIWIMGVISGPGQKPIDPLGFGLIGNAGLTKYLTFVGIIVIALAIAIRAAMRGLLWTRSLQRLVLRIPKIGPALQTVALARLAWVMSQTMNTSMDLRVSLKLSLQSTRNARYIDRIARIDAEIAKGNSIYEAFCDAGCFPHDFLESVHVGEQSGNLVESMAHLSSIYQEQARAALAFLAALGGYIVWIAIAAIIILVIFRLAFFYLGALNGAGLG